MKGIAGFWVFVGLLALASAASAQDALEVDHAVEQLMNRLTTPVERAQQAEEVQQQYEKAPEYSKAQEIALSSTKSLKQRETTEMGRLIEMLTASGEGKVIQIGETGVLFIQLDRQGSLTEGSQVDLMRARPPARMDDERVGSDEESLGTARIIKLIRDKALARMAGNAKRIAKPGDKIYVADRKTRRLVVASFTYNNDLTEFSISLQEKLITALVNRGLKVVERSQLEKVIMEQKLSYSGLIDLNSAQQVGKLLGAVGMLLGTITDEGNAVAVNARLVEVETADILTAAEVELAKTPLVAQRLGKIIRAPGVQP
ncbi:MAG: FlgO family outer membrane protein [Candidatus Contendobacter sp.]|nr:FlgO family outer membrane protein [Candidatus Contendobacter sp.]MDS4058171.1 FlgO family outer membrane protein [Candidatus Contendobacter sp.]